MPEKFPSVRAMIANFHVPSQNSISRQPNRVQNPRWSGLEHEMLCAPRRHADSESMVNGANSCSVTGGVTASCGCGQKAGHCPCDGSPTSMSNKCNSAPVNTLTRTKVITATWKHVSVWSRGGTHSLRLPGSLGLLSWRTDELQYKRKLGCNCAIPDVGKTNGGAVLRGSRPSQYPAGVALIKVEFTRKGHRSMVDLPSRRCAGSLRRVLQYQSS